MRRRLFFLLFSFLLASNALAASKSLFVVVTLDGFGANRLSPSLNKQVLEKYGDKKEAKEFFQLPPLPFLKKLSRSPDVLYLEKGIEPLFPTITNTNHASLMTGKEPREHQLLGNYYAEKVPGLGYKMVSFPASFRPEFYDEIQPPTRIRQQFNIGSVFWPSTSGPRTHDPRFSIPEIFSLSILANPFKSKEALFSYQNGSVTLENYLELLHGQSVVKSKGSGSLCTEKKLKAVLLQLIEQVETSSFYQRFSQDLKNVEE
ncbi:MAG: alkaline phosphatase family protein, partial [bacterium]|nr:alkaline phosphatase family protein [bacterium]